MAKGSQGSKVEALHPLVLRAAEEQEQETFLNDIIAKIHRAGVLEAHRAQEPFPGLHSEIRKLLQGEGIQRFYEYLIPLFAGLARVPSLDLPQDDRWLRIRALPVPADVKLWFKTEVGAVLHSVGLASEGALHPNRQYEELVALMLLWPEPIEDAHELPWLPLGFGVEDDGRTPPQVPTEPDIRSRMRDAADRIRGYLHRPWQQYGASPHGSSTKSKRNKAAKDEAKLDAGRKAYKLWEQAGGDNQGRLIAGNRASVSGPGVHQGGEFP